MKKYFVLLSLFFLQSCCSESLHDVDANKMIDIARWRSCDCGLKSRTFDVCIYKLQPQFDKLSKKERNRVAVNFVVYGNLNNSSLLFFAQLISPYHQEIIYSLEAVKDSELKDNFSLNERDIINYRESVKLLSGLEETR
jgi:hypothetical protein